MIEVGKIVDRAAWGRPAGEREKKRREDAAAQVKRAESMPFKTSYFTIPRPRIFGPLGEER